MKYFSRIILVVVLVTIFFISFVSAADDPPRSGEDARGLSGIEAGLTETAKPVFGNVTVGGIDTDTQFFESTVGRLIGYALSIIGIVLIGFLTYGGFVWLNARGRSEEVDRAKDILQNSIIGIGLVLVAFAVVYMASFLLSQATLLDNPYRAGQFGGS